MITHRNAWANAVGTLVHFHITVGDRYLWTLPMFHANGWTFVWIVTAVGGTHVCLPKVEPARVFELIRNEKVGWLCAAPTILIALANAPADVRGDVPKGVHVITAGAAPAAATIERMEGELGWEVTQVYGLTETAPFITICEPRPEHKKLGTTERGIVKARTGVELITSGELRVVDGDGKDVPADGAALGEIVARGNVIMQGYYNDPEATKKVMGDGWFHTGDAAVHAPGRLRRDPRPDQGRDHQRRREHLDPGGRRRAAAPSRGAGGGHRRTAAREVGRGAARLRRAEGRRHGHGAGADRRSCRDRLAHFKAPHSVTFVQELPKTATGKIQKYVLRKGAAAVVRQ